MNRFTVPGDIPGLLRRGSPVAVSRPDGTLAYGVVAMLSDGPSVTIAPDGGEQSPWTVWVPGWVGAFVALDLTDPTGRVHAQWWVAEEKIFVPGWAIAQGLDPNRVLEVLHHPAVDTPWWTPERISLLAEVVLRLAGCAT